MAPGSVRGKRVTSQGVFEAVGGQSRGKLADSDLNEIEEKACPGAGACGGQFTANTMAMVCEFLGVAAMGSGGVPATHPSKMRQAQATGRLVMELVKSQRLPKQILMRSAFENAVASVAATGGSTNAVLHLLAIAHTADVPFVIEDFEQ